MYKETVKPIENQNMLAFIAIIAAVAVYAVGFGVINAISPPYAWAFQLAVICVVVYIVYTLFTRIMGDYVYILDGGVLYCGSQTGSRIRQIAEIPAGSIKEIVNYSKNYPGVAKSYNAVKSLSKKNAKTAVFEADGKICALYFEPTDELVGLLLAEK